jgi:nucleoside-diphosphate-sugar epimerase
MKILIAGGAGYVGSVLVPKLLERDYEVEVLDLLWFGNHLPPAVKVIQKDILDVAEEELRGYDQVVFLGGLSNDPMADYSPSKNFVSNAACPAYLAYLSKRVGVKRFVYSSSCSVYGYTVNELYNETSPAVPSYPYGISKLQGEAGVMQMQDKSFSVVVLRKGTVCGYSPRMRLDLVVNTMFKTAVCDRLITVNNPAIWRPILAAQDAANAYVRAVECSESISGIFNVASGNYTLGEIADDVHEGIQEYLKMDVKLKIKHIHDLRNYKVSFEKAEKTLGFKPRFDVKGIVRELVENQAKFSDFQNPAYYNITTFKQLDARAAGA